MDYIAEGNEDANNIIIKKYEPLINKIAIKMLPYCKNNGLDLNDLVQEGMIGLNHAIEKYQEMENTLFYTYARKCIERKIISVVVSSNRNKNKILNESISYDDDENLIIKFISDTSPSPEDLLISEEIKEKMLLKIKDKLTELEESVFTLMINGFKYKEIAEILDKDEKSIDNTIQRLKSKIRKVINM